MKPLKAAQVYRCYSWSLKLVEHAQLRCNFALKYKDQPSVNFPPPHPPPPPHSPSQWFPLAFFPPILGLRLILKILYFLQKAINSAWDISYLAIFWTPPCVASVDWIRPDPVPSCLCMVRGHEWSACSKGMHLSSRNVLKVLWRPQEWWSRSPAHRHWSESIMWNSKNNSNCFFFVVISATICCRLDQKYIVGVNSKRTCQ